MLLIDNAGIFGKAYFFLDGPCCFLKNLFVRFDVVTMKESNNIKEEKLVSVIVPNYNNSKYIKECILSICEQSYKNIEIIVVDDASTDDSLIVLDEIKQKEKTKIHIIALKENRGVSYARNIGIDSSSGYFITFLDADDKYSKSKIEYEVKVICDNVASFSNVLLFFGENECKNKKVFGRFNAFSGRLRRKVILNLMPCPRDMLINKEKLLKSGIRYDENISLYEDFRFFILLSMYGSIIYADNLGTLYRIHGSGLSSVGKYKHIEAKRDIINQFSTNNLERNISHFMTFNRISKHIRRVLLLFIYLLNVSNSFIKVKL